MTLAPILNAEPLVQFHLLGATMAVMTGPVALYRRRRDRVHKVTGYVWGSAMMALAISGLFMHSLAIIGPFGPIHLLSVVTILSLWRGFHLIRQRRIADHARWMRNFYWYAIGFSALFALSPGRVLNRALFPDAPQHAWWLIGAGLFLLLLITTRRIPGLGQGPGARP